MKKILYIVSLFALVFAGCDPMEDIYEDVDALGIDNNIQNLEYTLTDDDYESMGTESGQPGDFNTFSEVVVATDFLPEFFNGKYPTLDVPSTVKVTYDFYQGGLDYIRSYENLNYYQITDDDYEKMGEAPGAHHNFAYNVHPEDYLPDFLADVYSDVSSGFVVEVNYKYYADYETSIVSEYWAFNGTAWVNAAYGTYTLVNTDYESMGTAPAAHHNFAYNVHPEDYLPDFLSQKYPDAPTNALVSLTYQYYDNGVSTITDYYSFDGSSWSLYIADIEIPSDVNRYDLVEADYNEMGFGQVFDDEDNADLISVFLEQKMPYAQDGDVYTVLFKYLDKDVITRSAVQYTKTDGMWVAYQSTIAKTAQYVRSTAGWVYDPSVLYNMEENDYQIIVDYVKNNVGTEYIDSYGTAEAYFGSNSHYVEFNISSGNYDSSFATWQDAAKAGIAAYLPLKFPNALAKVDGVDVNYIITFAGYAGSMVDYTITFKCIKSGPSPEFEYVEGPTVK